MTVEQEIRKFTKLMHDLDESRADFLKRCVVALAKMPEGKWEKMTEAAKLWANEATKAYERGSFLEFNAPLPPPVHNEFGEISIDAFEDFVSIQLPWNHFEILNSCLAASIKDLDEDAERDGERHDFYPMVEELRNATKTVVDLHANKPSESVEAAS